MAVGMCTGGPWCLIFTRSPEVGVGKEGWKTRDFLSLYRELS